MTFGSVRDEDSHGEGVEQEPRGKQRDRHAEQGRWERLPEPAPADLHGDDIEHGDDEHGQEVLSHGVRPLSVVRLRRNPLPR